MDDAGVPANPSGPSWTDPVRRRWETIPPQRRRDLNRIFSLLPSSLQRWRGLLEAGLTHVRLTAGDRRRVAVLGPPNAGKSTLYNRLILSKRDLAAVGPAPGTTRSLQEGDVGLFTVVDTPGAGASQGAQGEAGDGRGQAMELALEAVRKADVLVILFDGSRPLGDADRELLQLLVGSGKPWIVALNKMDAIPKDRAGIHGRAAQALGLPVEDVIPISARTGGGLERLLTEVARREPEIVAALGEALPAYRGALARAAITRAASTAAAIALAPLPMISFIPLTVVQTALVLTLARIYGYRISLARARELIVTFGIGLMARSLFYELMKFGGPPGWLVSAGVAAGATTALGHGAAAWFDRGERLSHQRMQQLSGSVGKAIVGGMRGRRRPKRAELERAVGTALDQALPASAGKTGAGEAGAGDD